MSQLLKVKGIGQTTADKLTEQQINTVEELANSPIGTIMAVTGFGELRSGAIREAASELIAEPAEPSLTSDTEPVETPAEEFELEANPEEASEAGAKPEPKKKRKKKKKKKGKKDRSKKKKKATEKKKSKKKAENKKAKKKKGKKKKK